MVSLKSLLVMLFLLGSLGNAFAQDNFKELMQLQKRATEGPPADAQKAKGTLEDLAQKDDATATVILGQLYMTGGSGIAADTPKGLGLIRKAADLQNTDAMFILAMLHGNGRLGVQQDANLSNKWLIKAADAGHLEGQKLAAQRYLFGQDGMPTDFAKANKYFELASPSDPNSAHILGVHYYQGKGVPKDDQKAIHYWRQAAKAGHGPAQQFLRNRNLSW